MTEQQKISVIIPAYNIAPYIERCVTSVFLQTYPHVEIIVVNDGSTDATAKKLAFLEEKIPELVVVSQENRGLSAARNAGIRVASGAYIAFVDGDDYLAENYLELLWKAIQKEDAEIAMVDYARVSMCGRVRREPHFHMKSGNIVQSISGKEALHRLIVDNENVYARAWGKLYRRCLWENEAFPLGKCHEDEFVTYRILHRINRLALVAVPAYFYVQRKGSITNSPFSVKRLHKIQAMQERMQFFEKCGEEELVCFCRKHYMMQLQFGYARVWLYRKEERYRAKVMRIHAYRLFKRYEQALKKACTISEYGIVQLCFRCPALYVLLVWLYERFVCRR